MITIIIFNDGATPNRPSGPPPAAPFAGAAAARLESLASRYRDLIAANAPHPPPWYQRQTLAEIERVLHWKRERAARAEVVVALSALLAEVAS